jgi:hypothetical protein
MDPITPTAEELKQLADRRARKARTLVKNTAKAITAGLDKVKANMAVDNNAPIRCNGYLFVPMDNGETVVWRKGQLVDLSILTETADAPAVETTGDAPAADPTPAAPKKRGRKPKTAVQPA